MDSDHNYQYSSAGSSICKCESESCLSRSSEFTKSVTQSEKCETGDGFSDGKNSYLFQFCDNIIGLAIALNFKFKSVEREILK